MQDKTFRLFVVGVAMGAVITNVAWIVLLWLQN